MKRSEELFHQISTWLHFIGGYYNDEKKFVQEAKKYGISRRVPAQVIRGMEFGDRLVFLRYVGKGSVFAFAEGKIMGITLDGEISKEVGERLIDEGKASYEEGGGMVNRECGSYFIVGTYHTTATLKECMDIAQDIHAKKEKAEGKDLEPMFVMVNACLTKDYENPVYLTPAPKFTRGFTRSNDASFTAPGGYETERKVIGIEGYKKKDRPPKKPKNMPMLPSMI